MGGDLDAERRRARLTLVALISTTALSGVVSLIVNLATNTAQRFAIVPFLLLPPLVAVVYFVTLAQHGYELERDTTRPRIRNRVLLPPALAREAHELSSGIGGEALLLLIGAALAGVLAASLVRWPFELLSVIAGAMPGYSHRYWLIPLALIAVVLATTVERSEVVGVGQFYACVMVAILAAVASLPRTGPFVVLQRDIESDYAPQGGERTLLRSVQIAAKQPELFTTKDADFARWERKPRSQLEPAPVRSLAERPDFYDGVLVAVVGRLVNISKPLEAAGEDRATPYLLTVESLDRSTVVLVKTWQNDALAPAKCPETFGVVGLPIAYSSTSPRVLIYAVKTNCVSEPVSLNYEAGGAYAHVGTRLGSEGSSYSEWYEYVQAVRTVEPKVGLLKAASDPAKVILAGVGAIRWDDGRPIRTEDVRDFCKERLRLRVLTSGLPCQEYWLPPQG